MGQLAGILRREDATLLTEIPETDLTSAINAMLAAYQEQRNQAFQMLVQEQTTRRSQKTKVAGVIRGQRLGRDGRPLEERTIGEYEVAFHWERWGQALGWDREAFAYMTVADMQRNVIGVTAGNFEDHKVESFRSVLVKDNFTADDEFGSLTVRRLANGDGTLYPLPNGKTAAADHYMVSGFTGSAISATNNPFALLRAKLRVFAPTARILVYINELQLPDIQNGLTSFTDVPVEGLSTAMGQQVATPLGDIQVPGSFAGIDGATGVYVYVNNLVPDGYMIGQVVGAEAPLKRRVPEPIILQGFKLEAEETFDPFWKRIYRDRFGYAVANRIGMAILQLKGSGTYDTPTDYTLD